MSSSQLALPYRGFYCVGRMLVVVVPLGLSLLFLLLTRNALIAKKNLCENAHAGVEIQLKKRAALVPNLVETVRGYAAHEQKTLELVMQARSSVERASSHQQNADAAQKALAASLGQLLLVSESYPDLKADTHFQFLMRSLNEIEAQLSAARRSYNSSVNRLNNAVEQFPSNLVAKLFGFRKRNYFEATMSERAAPHVTVL